MRCDAFVPKNNGRGQNYKLGPKMKCTQKFGAKFCNFLPWRQKNLRSWKRKKKRKKKEIKIEKAKGYKEKRRKLYS